MVVLKYTFVYVTCHRNRISIRSNLLLPLCINVCRLIIQGKGAQIMICCDSNARLLCKTAWEQAEDTADAPYEVLFRLQSCSDSTPSRHCCSAVGNTHFLIEQSSCLIQPESRLKTLQLHLLNVCFAYRHAVTEHQGTAAVPCARPISS